MWTSQDRLFFSSFPFLSPVWLTWFLLSTTLQQHQKFNIMHDFEKSRSWWFWSSQSVTPSPTTLPLLYTYFATYVPQKKEFQSARQFPREKSILVCSFLPFVFSLHHTPPHINFVVVLHNSDCVRASLDFLLFSALFACWSFYEHFSRNLFSFQQQQKLQMQTVHASCMHCTRLISTIRQFFPLQDVILTRMAKVWKTCWSCYLLCEWMRVEKRCENVFCHVSCALCKRQNRNHQLGTPPYLSATFSQLSIIL